MPLQPIITLPEKPGLRPLPPPSWPDSFGIGDVLALGFATTVAMWGMGYVGHMPLTQLPTVVFVTAMLGCLLVGGFLAGRYTRRGIRAGVYVGLVAAFLNLLILGSLLQQNSPNTPAPGLWVPGTFLLSIGLSTLGGLIALAAGPPARGNVNWPAIFAGVTSAAALLLIAVGGLVTGFRAGMAVPDWPNSYGANMFLFPFQRMTGGVFYEHAHRLIGSLVGFASLTLAIYLTHLRAGRRVVLWVWLVGSCVGIQAILGGFRVIENNSLLAVIHGFFAHCVLAGLIALTVVLTGPWQQPGEIDVRPSGGSDRFLSVTLVFFILGQIFLGTLVRQLNILLLLHITVAVFVAALVFNCGMRAWGLNPRQRILRRAGVTLLLLVFLQLMLGLLAIIFRTPPVDRSPVATTTGPALLPLVTPTHALISTAHQTNAALLLATAVILALYSRRLLNPRLPDAP